MLSVELSCRSAI